jgi:hypothetical protein
MFTTYVTAEEEAASQVYILFIQSFFYIVDIFYFIAVQVFNFLELLLLNKFQWKNLSRQLKEQHRSSTQQMET